MKKKTWFTFMALVLTFVIACTAVGNIVLAEEAKGVPGDTNPAIEVAKKTANSVVGVITYNATWTRNAGDQKKMMGQGSGVVIQDGFIVTNYHVVEDGNTYQVLLPNGEYADATLKGYDSSTDLAVLQVESDTLVPVSLGSSSDLVVGNSVYAIGNPGGTVLANTMTSGIVSALERTSVNTTNTTRTISYIQHDAPINNGNSGGGLFNVNGELIGINTLKYAGSSFSSTSFEGLGFAIPVDTVAPIAFDIIENGKVMRAQLGVTVSDQEGPDDARSDYPPASVKIHSLVENGPAEKAGLQPYDFITEVDGVRVTTMNALTTELDKHQEGDVVTLTVVRYDNAMNVYNRVNGYNSDNNKNGGYGDNGGNYGDNYGNYGDNYGDYYGNYGDYFGNFGSFFGFPFGYGYNYGNGNNGNSNNYYNSYDASISGPFQTLTIDVTLEILP